MAMDNFLAKFSPQYFNEKRHAKFSNYCSFVNSKIQLYVASIYLAAAFSIPLAFRGNDFWGRQLTFRLASILLLTGSAITIIDPSISTQSIGRVIIGFGVGLLYQVIPVILSELGLKIEKQVNKEFACFIALGSTPRWLIEHGRGDEARNVLHKVIGSLHVNNIYEEIEEIVLRSRSGSQWREILAGRSRPALVITIVSQIFLQSLGISVYTNYGPLLLDSLGANYHNAFLFPFLASGASTLVACLQPLVFKYWRRRPLLIASHVMQLSVVCAWSIFYHDVWSHLYLHRFPVYIIISFAIVYVLAYSIAAGPLPWLGVSFPSSTATLGSTLGLETIMVLSFSINMFSFRLICLLRAYFFLYYAFWAIVMSFFILFLVPETVGVLTHSMPRRIWSRHWLWSTYMSYDDPYT